jgi:hypothetical protein
MMMSSKAYPESKGLATEVGEHPWWRGHGHSHLRLRQRNLNHQQPKAVHGWV